LTNVDGLKGLTGLQTLEFRSCDALPQADQDELRSCLPTTDIKF